MKSMPAGFIIVCCRASGKLSGYGTVDLNVKMLKAIPRGVPLIAEGKAIFISRSLGVSEGTLKDVDGNLYAHATATCLIIRPS